MRPDGGAALADADAEDRGPTQTGQRLRRLLQDVPAGERCPSTCLTPAVFNHLTCLFAPPLQVCGVLESLEQEYRREEDWCGGGDRQPEQLLPLINKHMEQKEAFLKVVEGAELWRRGGAELRLSDICMLNLTCSSYCLVSVATGVHAGQAERGGFPQVHPPQQRHHGEHLRPQRHRLRGYRGHRALQGT